ncbi:DNA/RNA non-specific endonuclease [Acinetobacter sp. MD2(2019)]|uniref:DNA/RNA non-specific endonuclease n=1 Tax=Acinetobacter sp. MD2(2019) TaxID=2605273 RepID=UPI002D778C3B|nr:DNA/RNA non-specific endonuclease [Acinetobacter sp. MD2(2019)]
MSVKKQRLVSLRNTVLGVFVLGATSPVFAKLPSLSAVFEHNSSRCLGQFYQETPPFLTKDSLTKKSYPLCFNGFNVMYSGVSKTPLWSAEHLTPERFSQRIKREDSFHEETQIPAEYRARLADYRASGYDRGHMSPNADMSDTASQSDSFSLANMVPQAPKNNQEVWRKLEEATRTMVKKNKQDVYVVTGPIFSGQRLKTIGNGVLVPSAVFKAVYYPKTGVIGAYYAPNNNSQQVYVVSVCEIEDLTGINVFPSLNEQTKRKTYHLPLVMTDVKANAKVAYLNWDAKSQCAVDVADESLQALQKQFQPHSADSAASATGKESASTSQIETKINEISGNWLHNLIKQLIEAILEFILKLLKGA